MFESTKMLNQVSCTVLIWDIKGKKRLLSKNTKRSECEYWLTLWSLGKVKVNAYDPTI